MGMDNNNLISIDKIRDFTREELVEYKRSFITQEIFMDIADLCMLNGFILQEINFKDDMKYHITFKNMYRKNESLREITINNLEKNSGIKLLKVLLKEFKEIIRAKYLKNK